MTNKQKKYSNDVIEYNKSLKPFYKSISEKIDDIISVYHCKMCGDCCRFDNNLFEDEREYGTMLFPDELIHFGNKNSVWIDEKDAAYLKKPCPFFHENKCKIHRGRPMVCKFFPFGVFFDGIELFIELAMCPLGKEIYIKWLEMGESCGYKIQKIDLNKIDAKQSAKFNKFQIKILFNEFIEWSRNNKL